MSQSDRPAEFKVITRQSDHPGQSDRENGQSDRQSDRKVITRLIWLTVAEIAETTGLGLRRLRIKAKNWEGGRLRSGTHATEYQVEQLPTEIQKLLMSGQADQPTGERPTEAEAVEATPIAPAERAEIDGKLEILRAYDAFVAGYCREQGLKDLGCHEAFDRAYQAGEIAVSAQTRRLFERAGRAKLKGWKADLAKGVNALANRYGLRKGRSKVEGEMAEFVKAMVVQFPHSNPEKVMDGLMARFGAVPFGKDTLRRFMDKFRRENAEVLMAISNPDQWKNQRMVAFGSYSEGIDAPNQLWEFDSTPADLLLSDGRYSVVGVVDVATRRSRLLVSKTSKATAILSLFRWCLLNWGVPEAIKTDNGKDYTANHVVRVLMSFEPAIAHLTCQPFSPWQKPHIERSFKTFSHEILELLPGFVGHSVAEAQELRARQAFSDRLFKKNQTVELKLSASEFQSFCDKWTETQAHQPHEGLKGRTPFQVLTSYTGTLRKLAAGSDRALDILLAPAPGKQGERTVQKQGIRLEDAWFIAAELEEFVGQMVLVRQDLFDLGRIYVFGGEKVEFLCVAECPERTGVSRAEIATVAKERQKKRVGEAKKALKAAAKGQKVGEIAHEILEDRVSAAASLTQFPQAAEVVGLGEFEKAASALTPAVATPRNELRKKEVDLELKNSRQQATAAEMAYAVGTPTEAEWEKAYRRRRFGQLSEVDQARYRRFVGANPECVDALDPPRMWDLPDDLQGGLSLKSQKAVLGWAVESRPHLEAEILMRFPQLREPEETIDLKGVW